MKNNIKKTDFMIIGGGIMGTTLASILSEIDPGIKIDLFEKLNGLGLESTNCLNNAGTGHAGYCELHYTPLGKNNTINIDKALAINKNFEISLQYWSYMTKKYKAFNAKKFICRVPHISLVFGRENIAFLKKRYLLFKKHHIFKSITFSEDTKEIKKWAPLVIIGRDKNVKVAATKVNEGSDVNFGNVCKELLKILKTKINFGLHLDQEIVKIDKNKDGSWYVLVKNHLTSKTKEFNAKFVFIGAGGQAIHLLQKTKIKEQSGYGGFPVSGRWLICSNSKIVEKHYAKVYSLALESGPSMTAPHLDLRIVDGKKILLFGPFAGFTFKFLKFGSYLDLIKSLKFKNVMPMIDVLLNNWNLFKYLIFESFQTKKSRLKSLKLFYPKAEADDWTLAIAGQRVQIIKPYQKNKGKLEFGTDIVFSEDKTLAALLGASPGASVAVDSMIQIIEKNFLMRYKRNEVKRKLQKIIPSYGHNLITNKNLLKRIRRDTHITLGLKT